VMDDHNVCCYAVKPAATADVVAVPELPVCGAAAPPAPIVHTCSRDANGAAHQACNACSCTDVWHVPCTSTAGNAGCTLAAGDPDNACAFDDAGTCCYVQPPAPPAVKPAATADVVAVPELPVCGAAAPPAPIVHNCNSDANGAAHQTCTACGCTADWKVPCTSTAGNAGCTLAAGDPDNACVFDDAGQCCYVVPPAIGSQADVVV
jgi:hypothetical protein